MSQRCVNGEIQTKIRRYVEYIHNEDKEGFQRGEYLYNLLSKNLQNEINLDIYFKMTKEIPLFKKNFSDKFLIFLSKNIEEKSFATGEIIAEV